MGYEGSEGLAQMVHIQGRRLSNPDLCPLGQDHSALSPAHDNDRGQRTYLKKPVEEWSLPGVGRTRHRAEAGLEHTTPSGAPKAVLLSGGEGIPCPKREREALGHMCKIRVAEEAWLKPEPGLVRRDTVPAQSWLPFSPKCTLTRLSSRESLLQREPCPVGKA